MCMYQSTKMDVYTDTYVIRFEDIFREIIFKLVLLLLLSNYAPLDLLDFKYIPCSTVLLHPFFFFFKFIF